MGSETNAGGGQRPHHCSWWWALVSPHHCCSWWWVFTSLHHRHPFSFIVDVVHLCMFHVVVFHCWPCIWCWVRWRVLAVKCQWAVNSGGVTLVGWVCPAMACGGQGWFLWALAVVCGLLCVSRIFVAIVGWSWSFIGRLLSFLDGLDRMSGWAWFTITWGQRGGEVDVGCHWAMCQGCGQHRWHGGGWLKKEDTSQGCDTLGSCSTCM